MAKLTPIGSIPPTGEVPEKMVAQVIRPERYGDPITAFQVEEIAVPEINPHEVLIAVMAAGINYNNVWAARGMVVICAGTTGYSANVDLRYHWVHQKRLQGSHPSNDQQAAAYNQLVVDGIIDPCVGKVYAFEDIGKAHADMEVGKTVFGNRVALVGAPEPGLGRQ